MLIVKLMIILKSGGVDLSNNTFCDLYSYDLSHLYYKGLESPSAYNMKPRDWKMISEGNSLLCRVGAASTFKDQYWYLWGGKSIIKCQICSFNYP